MALKIVFVEKAVVNESGMKGKDWQSGDKLDALYFEYRNQVTFFDVDIKETENLLDVLKENLAGINEKRLTENKHEVIMSVDHLSFLSLPEEWANLTYSDIVHLRPSKQYGKRLVVIKTQNQRKRQQKFPFFNNHKSFSKLPL